MFHVQPPQSLQRRILRDTQMVFELRDPLSQCEELVVEPVIKRSVRLELLTQRPESSLIPRTVGRLPAMMSCRTTYRRS